MKLTIEQLQYVLDTYDNGVLSTGAHKADEGLYCALECVSLARNNGRKNFTDNPIAVGMPDIRAINDAYWSSDALRTKTMLPLLAALSDWSTWNTARKVRYVTRISIRTVNLIVAKLPYLSDAIRTQCREADTVAAADAAAADAAAAAVAAAKFNRLATRLLAMSREELAPYLRAMLNRKVRVR